MKIIMQMIKLFLLLVVLAYAGNCQTVEDKSDTKSNKSILMAVIIQAFIPGLGNYYIDDNWVKPVIYIPIIMGSGVSAAMLSSSSYKYKDPLVTAGFAICAGTIILSYADLIRSFIRYDIKFVHISPGSISISYDF